MRYRQVDCLMSTFKSTEDIDAWRRSRLAARKIYELSQIGAFAADREFSDHINRTACSVMSNVAEGFERHGNREFIQFLAIAKGSAGEFRSQLYQAYDRKYISKADFDNLLREVTEIMRLIGGLMRYLKSVGHNGPKFK